MVSVAGRFSGLLYRESPITEPGILRQIRTHENAVVGHSRAPSHCKKCPIVHWNLYPANELKPSMVGELD